MARSSACGRLTVLCCAVVTSGWLDAPAPLAAAEDRALLLDAMFQDHAVLQRDRPIAISGYGQPDERVTVTLNGHSVTASADASGRWQAELPPQAAGGPYELTAAGSAGERRTIGDLLIGDVYLCSGQSNMELPVARTLNAEREIQQAASDSIRLLSIAHAASPAPRDRFTPRPAWRRAAPDTVGDFSATCYYFARELQKTARVPLGLIHSSWGGSNIEAWISADGLLRMGGFDQQVELLSLYARDEAAAIRRLGEIWEAWWRSRVPTPAGDEPWRSRSAQSWRGVPQLANWKTWGVPELADFDGMVWFRRAVSLSEAQAGQAATLSLGAIDEVDQTWVNGQAIANTFGWGVPRDYTLPAGVLSAGDNLIVVNVLSTWASGGMLGPAESIRLRFADGSELPLGEGWQYRMAPPDLESPPRAPWHTIGGLSTLYNAMIAPIGPYGMRGVVWYQGESNAGAAEAYEVQLAGLMADWRRAFGPELPFLVVQLPNFGRPLAAPAASGWASLRDAQRRAVLRDRRAGLAVTIDIGDRHELHPPNKQEVGRRLARAARHVVYGEALSPSGPVPASVERDGSQVVLTFGDVEGRLVTYSAAHPIGFELCGAAQASCRFVRAAALDGNRIVLDDTGASSPATRVRYCWGDAPICNLYDESELPAGPFELPIGTSPAPTTGK
jgi:sialate O-acetylesterase